MEEKEKKEQPEVSLASLSAEVQKVGEALGQVKEDVLANRFDPEKVKKFCSEEFATLIAKQNVLREALGMKTSTEKARFKTPDEILDVRPGTTGYTDEVRTFHEMNDTLVLLGALNRADAKAVKIRDVRKTKTYDKLRDIAERAFGVDVKADMDTATAGEGLEWIPTDFSSTLVEYIRLELRVAALHADIPMPSDPFKLPVQTGKITAKLGSENTAPTGVVVPTGNVQLDAEKIIAFVPFSYEVEEDAVVAVAPIVQMEIAAAIADGIENAIVNGDRTTATTGHLDKDINDAADATQIQLAWDGYRRFTLVTNSTFKTNFNNAFTEALVRSVRGKMVKYGVKPRDLAYVVGIDNYIKMLEFPSLQTMDKYGPNATVLSGELGKIDGIPIIVSEYIRQDLSDDGTQGNGTGTDRSTILLVHRPSWLLGTRRAMLAESFRDVTKQQIQLVVSQRKSFVASRTGEKIAWCGYNTNTG